MSSFLVPFDASDSAFCTLWLGVADIGFMSVPVDRILVLMSCQFNGLYHDFGLVPY